MPIGRYFGSAIDATVRLLPATSPVTETFLPAYFSICFASPFRMNILSPATRAYLLPDFAQARVQSVSECPGIMCFCLHMSSLTIPVTVCGEAMVMLVKAALMSQMVAENPTWGAP